MFQRGGRSQNGVSQTAVKSVLFAKLACRKGSLALPLTSFRRGVPRNFATLAFELGVVRLVVLRILGALPDHQTVHHGRKKADICNGRPSTGSRSCHFLRGSSHACRGNGRGATTSISSRSKTFAWSPRPCDRERPRLRGGVPSRLDFLSVPAKAVSSSTLFDLQLLRQNLTAIDWTTKFPQVPEVETKFGHIVWGRFEIRQALRLCRSFRNQVGTVERINLGNRQQCLSNIYI